MIKHLAALAALSLISACATTPPEPPARFVCSEPDCEGDDLEKLETGKATIASVMNVPDKAVFKQVYLTDRGVCGMATGINGFGGYPPPRRFIVADGNAGFEPANSQNDVLGSLITGSVWSRNWRKYCGS